MVTAIALFVYWILVEIEGNHKISLRLSLIALVISICITILALCVFRKNREFLQRIY